MKEKTFRQRVISALGPTQEHVAEVLDIRQSNISLWSRRHPDPGSMAELLEGALAQLSDEDLRRVLKSALAERGAKV